MARQVLLVLVAWAMLMAPGPVWGQTLLRWKLAAGDALVIDVQQTTNSEVGFSGKSARTKIDLGMQLGWTVVGSDEKGIKIKQTVQRITFQLDSDKPEVNYDSADKARPTGRAREVADAVKPLLGAEVELTMSDRGAIIDTKPLNAAAEKLFAAENPDQSPSVFSRQAIQTLLRQSLVLLPEKAVAAQETWTDEPRDLKAAAGTFSQKTTFRLTDPVEQEGQKLVAIALTGKIEQPTSGDAKPKEGAPMLKLKSHEQTGKILFSAEQGRLVSAEQTQKLTTERPYRETTIVVTLESKQTTTVKPAGAQNLPTP